MYDIIYFQRKIEEILNIKHLFFCCIHTVNRIEAFIIPTGSACVHILYIYKQGAEIGAKY